MPEIKVSVPLAKFDNDEWDEFSDFQSSSEPNRNKNVSRTVVSTPNDNDVLDNMSDTTDNLDDTFSTSLEDLVNTFDEKITKCFHNYEDEVDKYAPVQVRSQEEIMNDCQMWWTITGNFGNLLPIDWSKSHTRQKFLPVLNLNSNLDGTSPVSTGATPLVGGDEEEAVAQDLDLHTLILESGDGTTPGDPPLKTADEVIREIDDIMQEGSSSEDEGCTSSTHSSVGSEAGRSSLRPLPSPLYHDKLSSLTVSQLNECLMELETVISQYSETLISQLALRDELEFQKELKNSFISLLLQVQNKRRNFNVDKKNVKKSTNHGAGPKYLTTVIPYDVGHGPPDNQSLQILNKILAAINEDSPTVPALLTDYILKVLCPS
ncbi:fasciculation and elongation protein zeta-2 [Hyalella azteca]|uniref:Fasciculation and elongation protein zeta-2 n=1 Tax=Hyalella azteca TaxID=294128 RepID=A0A8B7PRS0_HYAAZ|nr:fasciculation and elongation protein zeta-2 [Hyalella azteca]